MMKSYERLALLMFLCGAMIALTPQKAWSQEKTVSATDSKELAIVFPLRVEDPLIFQGILADKPDARSILRVLRDTLKTSQSLSNGNPYPEATSLNTLLIASFRKQIKTTSFINYSIDALQSQVSSLDTAEALFSIKDFATVDIACFNIYEIVDGLIRFYLLFVQKDGMVAVYLSEAVPLFDLPRITDDAVKYFINNGLVSSGVQGQPNVENSISSQAPEAKLPIIQLWKNKIEYENSQNAFKFGIGGTAIGVSLTFVSAGIWQMYREAAYRNSAFSNESTISGIAAGTCAAITAAFLTFTVIDAVRMLKASQ